MSWTQDKWISFIYICNYLFCVCNKISLMRGNEHIYHQRSSFWKLKNNVLFFLISSSTFHDRHFRIFNKWTNSKNTLSLSQRLINDFQNFQESKQLILILTVLLCYERLFFYISNDIVQFFNDYYLIDLNVLLNDKSLNNRRVIFKRMCFSFFQVLIIFNDKYKNMT